MMLVGEEKGWLDMAGDILKEVRQAESWSALIGDWREQWQVFRYVEAGGSNGRSSGTLDTGGSRGSSSVMLETRGSNSRS